MKLRVICVLGALALAGVIAQAQGSKDVPPKAMTIEALTPAALEKVMPLLRADSATGNGPGEDRFAAIGMNKQEYIALKNALMVARLDFRNPSRMVGPDDPRLDVRRRNVAFYKSNQASLDAVVPRLTADRSCSLCGSAR